MDHAGHAVSLVDVGTAEEHQQLAVAGPHRADLPGVSGHGRRREPGQVRGAELGGRLAQPVDHGQPPGPEDQGDVVAGDAGQLAEPVGPAGVAEAGRLKDRDTGRSGALLHRGRQQPLPPPGRAVGLSDNSDDVVRSEEGLERRQGEAGCPVEEDLHADHATARAAVACRSGCARGPAVLP